jgi:hypothetical protein
MCPSRSRSLPPSADIVPSIRIRPLLIRKTPGRRTAAPADPSQAK